MSTDEKSDSSNSKLDNSNLDNPNKSLTCVIPDIKAVSIDEFENTISEFVKLQSGNYNTFEIHVEILNQLFSNPALNGGNYKLSFCHDPNSIRCNRYNNVPLYNETRVKLKHKPYSNNSDYIHASHVNNPFTYPDKCKYQRNYIATQAPIKSTIADFWRMVWFENSSVIVMLTNFKEYNFKDKQHHNKAIEYWNTKLHVPNKYDDFTLTLQSETVISDYIVRNFTLEYYILGFSPEKRNIQHFQYIGCPDQGIPEIISFYNFYNDYRNALKKSESSGPVIVHCSAGIGRSGMFAVIDLVVDYLLYCFENNIKPSINIFAVAEHLRKCRHGAIQNSTQYKFCYDYINFLLKNRELLKPLNN